MDTTHRCRQPHPHSDSHIFSQKYKYKPMVMVKCQLRILHQWKLFDFKFIWRVISSSTIHLSVARNNSTLNFNFNFDWSTEQNRRQIKKNRVIHSIAWHKCQSNFQSRNSFIQLKFLKSFVAGPFFDGYSIDAVAQYCHTFSSKWSFRNSLYACATTARAFHFLLSMVWRRRHWHAYNDYVEWNEHSVHNIFAKSE